MIDALKLFASKLTPPSGFVGGRWALPSLTGAADAFLALSLVKETSKAILAITSGIPDAERLFNDLKYLTAKKPVKVLEFPPLLSEDHSALGDRIKAVAALQAAASTDDAIIIVAPYPALLQPIPALSAAAITLEIDNQQGQTPNKFVEICNILSKNGYKRVPLVECEGDYSVRGGIVDVWSPGDEFPIRAEFFGDDLESLRSFDAATQLSIKRLNRVELLPISDQPNEQSSRKLIELLPAASTLVAFEHHSYGLSSLIAEPANAKFSIFTTGFPAPDKTPTINLAISSLPGFAELGADEAHHPELFEAARKRLDQHLAAAEKRGIAVVRQDDLSGGFEIDGLIIVTKADRIFTKRRQLKPRGRRNAAERVNDFDELEPGEYVVHVDHGVGRYLGSSEIVTDGRRTEAFTIEYADGAKLHVPAAHAHLLSRYVGVKGESIKLHRLDGKKWLKDRQDAQHAVADLAAALLETQAKREVSPGFAYTIDCEGIAAFEAAFPYEETPDQLAAIAAIKHDLADAKPMDRLICGDAGYGKTEVAMRAAYIAAMNGKQVAVLAPTTILAEQHFETFTARFDGTPIRIESMSRFQSRVTHEGTFKRLLNGACDIIIGTHALLSQKIAFRDLGLIIIDEEQRFGVRHKEFLKHLRATADILTLSATPIPRTLYLSMTGARDLSLLRSPPRERVAVDTRIVADSDEIIRHAINAELERGGQIFFLHNRVTTIGKVEKRLLALFEKSTSATAAAPKIVVAHGQMDSRTLARKMRDFERGEYDILLSTTIIESGIDIPRANTILVDHAEAFGLADLYQLRGRVGRSAKVGHAIFLLPASGLIDADARERLKALQRHGGLGSGFNLAVRDLELRGAGNLLGSQQSGHIAAVGFTLYCQLLKRTIALLKGEKVKEVVDVKINLDFLDPHLPYDYIEEDSLRMNLLRRFAEAQDLTTVKALKNEMQDRFGPPNEEAQYFVKAAEIRVLAARADINAIDTKDNRAICYRGSQREIIKVVDLKGKNTSKKLAEIRQALS